jgi:hypothetical protein
VGDTKRNEFLRRSAKWEIRNEMNSCGDRPSGRYETK